MNKILPNFTMVLLAFLLLSFIYNTDNAAATAEQRDGIYIFLLSKPAAGYDIQGTVKVGMTITSNPLDVLIRKCKKEYPSAQGLVISDPDLQKAKAECIKFKQ